MAYAGEGTGRGIPAPRVHFFFGDRCRMAIYAALRSLGFPAVSYEMSEAVARILQTQNARERYYAGEDLFSGVQSPEDRTVELDAVITQIANLIAF